ncbi:NAD-binding protein [Mycena belliarum]|uniref:NAD-binding protein n=1 Tax=Mycena belliarum TaxID=1033014 RepID=A0AAD6UIZ3_9AGAR|nr:NAD-binding protein [Mycena belliae]
MSGTKTHFLVTGATGYIGGSVLTRFLAHPHADTFQFTAIVRDSQKAAKFEELGVHAVVGSHSDAHLVEKLASEADVVIAMADCDDVGAAKATLEGLRKRHTLGSRPIFINTSGTGVLVDDAKGMHSTDTVYDDSDADQIETLGSNQPHRPVDKVITQADAEGYVRSYIILPSTIYGIATGRLVELGIQNPHSIQIPQLINAALDRGQAGMVGEGKNLWPNVEVHELADLYIKLYDSIVADDATGHGRNGYYFGASGEHSLYDVGKAIGEAMVTLEKSSSPEPTTFTQEDLDKYFGGSPYLGTNSRCRPTHSRALGWSPVNSTGDMLASIRPEIEALIKKKNAGVA